MAFFKQGALVKRTTTTATAGGTTTLTSASQDNQQFTGTTTQTIVLPDATTLPIGRSFVIRNRSTGALTVNFNGGSLAKTLNQDTEREFLVIDNSSSAGTWDITTGGSSTSSVLNVAIKTANYTLTGSDDVILVSGSGGAFTLTLPAAASNAGKVFRIKRTDNTLANVVTIDANASETIDGPLTKPLNTINEEYEIISDGTNWQVLSHKTATNWISFTPTGSASLGTLGAASAEWRRRDGNIVEQRGVIQVGVTTGSQAQINFPTNMPASVSGLGNTICGSGDRTNTLPSHFELSSEAVTYFVPMIQRSLLNANSAFATNETFSYTASVAIDGWGE